MKRRVLITMLIVLIILVIQNNNINTHFQLTAQGLEIRKYIHLDKSEFNQNKGEKVTVLIMDTGINIHNDLDENRILYFKDFINGKENPYDDNGHGTFIAGIIGANGKLQGIAPEVGFVILKVMNENAETNPLTIKAALEWILNNYQKYNISVINMSFGIETKYGIDYKDEIIGLINKLHNKGIVTVVSSGNNGPGNDSILFPGEVNDVITVGFINNNNTYSLADDTLALASGRSNTSGCKPDIVTLGIDILSTDNHSMYEYKLQSGSSFATAIISGVIALLIEANRDLSPIEIKEILLNETVKPIENINGCESIGQLYF